MTAKSPNTRAREGSILVLGATGKTGRRIASRLHAMGIPVRIGSRSASPAFDWRDETTWDECLAGVDAVYVNYAPDLAIPGATGSVRAFVDRAKRHGVGRLVLLSGRGEEEAQACERIVQESRIDWTIVRASWFNQNFSEGAFLEMVQKGQIALPAADTPEPFVDAGDIADVAVAALTEQGHAGRVYELTGPRLLTFAQAVDEIAKVAGRTIEYVRVSPESFAAGVAEAGLPDDMAWLLDYLFTTVLDGRNAHLGDGVRRAIGREPRDFADYAREAAASGVWHAAARS
ncbi:MAG: NAD(P)H-binding protein [Betaproteobacteria bacterium]|nr:NAD(P)H-binding protein [Betaproteobacteria bacterium]